MGGASISSALLPQAHAFRCWVWSWDEGIDARVAVPGAYETEIERSAIPLKLMIVSLSRLIWKATAGLHK